MAVASVGIMAKCRLQVATWKVRKRWSQISGHLVQMRFVLLQISQIIRDLQTRLSDFWFDNFNEGTKFKAPHFASIHFATVKLHLHPLL